MNDTLKTIARRYSCRSFSDKPVSGADLRAIAEAGIQAPSARNAQGWHISVVANKALIAEIEAEGIRVLSELPDKSTYERVMGRGGKLFYNAQAVVFIAIKNGGTNAYAKIDLGIVAQNIALAAASLGIDNCHCGLAAFCFAGGKAGEFNKKLNLPDDCECGYGVLLGYANAQGAPHVPDKSKISLTK